MNLGRQSHTDAGSRLKKLDSHRVSISWQGVGSPPMRCGAMPRQRTQPAEATACLFKAGARDVLTRPKAKARLATNIATSYDAG